MFILCVLDIFILNACSQFIIKIKFSLKMMGIIMKCYVQCTLRLSALQVYPSFIVDSDGVSSEYFLSFWNVTNPKMDMYVIIFYYILPAVVVSCFLICETNHCFGTWLVCLRNHIQMEDKKLSGKFHMVWFRR